MIFFYAERVFGEKILELRELKKYGEMDYLNENWWALHTDNPFWAVRNMYKVCVSNGGMR
jgi:hypothetical protein